MSNKYKFINVYKKISSNGEDLKYEKINENMYMDEKAVESLLRGSFAIIKYTEEGPDLYYNV